MNEERPRYFIHKTAIYAGIPSALLAAFLFVLIPRGASAASYSAQRMIQSPAPTISAGGTAKVSIGFKNTGTATWKNSGANFVSIYTWSPKYRTSTFQDASWKSFRQPAVLRDVEVAPGQIGYVDFLLRAPSTPGTYTESFNLAAEDLAWIPGGEFSITITVIVSPSSPSPSPLPQESSRSEEQTSLLRTPQDGLSDVPKAQRSPERVEEGVLTPTPISSPYAAQRMVQSAQALGMKPGESKEFQIWHKNIGTATWNGWALQVNDSALGIASVVNGTIAFQDVSWPASDVVRRGTDTVAPGQLVINKFSLRAPTTLGNHRARFRIVTNNESVVGGEFEIPISVTNDGNVAVSPIDPLPAPVDLIPEPMIRVGLLTTDEIENRVDATADQPFEAKLADGTLLGRVEAGQIATVFYDKGAGRYVAKIPTNSFTSLQPIRLVPVTPGVMTITNWMNRPKWSSSLNDNQFRGSLEVRYAPTGYTWLINELPIEQYLHGLAETGNGSPSEYHKSIIVAARTYAYWHLTHPGKHVDGGFTLDDYWDQVYRGYGSEKRMGNFVASVDATRGQIVTYQNDVVPTAYFARSDGRTRGWHEVWGGAVKPWSVGVAVPQEIGNRLLGHGVGMSATGAYLMAGEGKQYPEILKYFYTGVELKRLW